MREQRARAGVWYGWSWSRDKKRHAFSCLADHRSIAEANKLQVSALACTEIPAALRPLGSSLRRARPAGPDGAVANLPSTRAVLCCPCIVDITSGCRAPATATATAAHLSVARLPHRDGERRINGVGADVTHRRKPATKAAERSSYRPRAFCRCAMSWSGARSLFFF
jgi:hypothetical protein